jgi:DNA-directed RNA polymerase alpha subunit
MCNLITNGTPISKAMKQVYKTRKVIIPFEDNDFNIPVPSLKMSNRSTNALMRNGLTTLQEAIDCLDMNTWSSIKGFGKESALEVFEKILDVAWDQMDLDKKTELLVQIDARNEAII